MSSNSVRHYDDLNPFVRSYDVKSLKSVLYSVVEGKTEEAYVIVRNSRNYPMPRFSSSDRFLFCWSAFLSLASWAFVSLPLFLLFLRPCLIHARMPDWGRAFVHGHAFLHSWSGPIALVVNLLHGATSLSNLTLVLFASFI